MMGTYLQALDLQSNSLEVYLQAIQRFPLLSREEEQELTVRYRKANDVEAARKLVSANLRFVVYIAKNYFSWGLPRADLIQEGNIGLMKAVKRFDPARGIRLITFAVRWIRAEIHNFIIKNWKIVKIATTKAQRKLFFNLRRFQKQLGWLSKEEAQNVARDLDVSEAEVFEMESRLKSQDVSLEGSQEDSREHKALIPLSTLAEPQENTENLFLEKSTQEYQEEKLQLAIQTLDDRSQMIMTLRWLREPKATLQELAEYYKVSIERIRQIETAALRKLRNQLALAGHAYAGLHFSS